MKKSLLIIGAFVALGLLFLGVMIVLPPLFFNSGNTNSVSIDKEVESLPVLTLRSFRQLRGTKYFSAEIVTSGGSSFYEYGSSRSFEFGDSGGGLIRNVVFLDSETLLSHTLLDDNRSFILGMVAFPDQPTKPVAPGEEPEIVPIQWFVYEIVHKDSNQDGELNRKDTRSVGVSDVDGARYKELLTAVSEIYNLTMLDSGELLTIYSRNGNRFAATIDLQSQEILVTQPLTDLGVEVK